jgi:hypothetical protein
MGQEKGPHQFQFIGVLAMAPMAGYVGAVVQVRLLCQNYLQTAHLRLLGKGRSIGGGMGSSDAMVGEIIEGKGGLNVKKLRETRVRRNVYMLITNAIIESSTKTFNSIF